VSYADERSKLLFFPDGSFVENNTVYAVCRTMESVLCSCWYSGIVLRAVFTFDQVVVSSMDVRTVFITFDQVVL